jgi:hypothetical protein
MRKEVNRGLNEQRMVLEEGQQADQRAKRRTMAPTAANKERPALQLPYPCWAGFSDGLQCALPCRVDCSGTYLLITRCFRRHYSHLGGIYGVLETNSITFPGASTIGRGAAMLMGVILER